MSQAFTDEELMARYAQQQDHRAFDELIDRHLSGVKRYLYFLCRDDAMAEDMTQEVWIKLIRAAPRYRPSAKFRTFLFTLARNHFVDEYRAQGREINAVSVEAAEEGDDPLPIVHPGAGPEGQAESRQQLDALKAVIDGLPLFQREAFLLYLEGHTAIEVAEIVGRPFEAVKGQIRYALEKVKARIPDPT